MLNKYWGIYKHDVNIVYERNAETTFNLQKTSTSAAIFFYEN